MARNSTAYDEDFYAWTREQATLLRSGQFSQVDVENVAEELESMGRSDKREIEAVSKFCSMHLLKWQAQVEIAGRPAGAAKIREQRRRIGKVVARVAEPSRRFRLPLIPPRPIPRRAERRRDETGLVRNHVPGRLPVYARSDPG